MADYSALIARARRVSADMRLRAIIPCNPAEQAADVIDELVAALSLIHVDAVIDRLRALTHKWQESADGADRGEWGAGQACGFEYAIEDVEKLIAALATSPDARGGNDD